MEKNNTESLPTSLEEVQAQFENWRRTRNNRRDPIPSRLWEAAVKLSDSYSINIVAKALRLNYSDLKEHVHERSAGANVKTLPAAGFIDLGCSQSHFESECVVKMQDASGLKIKMSVRGKADFNLLQLAKAFIDKGA
jgi:hypothetical protein